ncbi:MAG: sigma-70 family RNA polymerase sigma factor [Chitinophagia bacterium]|nr:sigma-70 family RNA polymerase sigma factor [Chitinophagia bacterium]
MKPDLYEQGLLKGLAEGDKRTIEIIYKDHYNMIQSLIINNSGSADEAKDIFQEALIVLYEKVRSGSFELNCQLKTYLYSVSKRLWLKKLSANSRFVAAAEDLEPTFPVDDEVESHKKRDAEFDMMEKAIASLGEPCKSLLEAYYLKKQNMQVIAAAFGYTNADNAKNQKYKCLVRLKKIFFAHYKNGMDHE